MTLLTAGTLGSTPGAALVSNGKPALFAVFDSVNNVYPTRASVTKDTTQIVIWVGPDANKVNITTGYALVNMDFFEGWSA